MNIKIITVTTLAEIDSWPTVEAFHDSDSALDVFNNKVSHVKALNRTIGFKRKGRAIDGRSFENIYFETGAFVQMEKH